MGAAPARTKVLQLTEWHMNVPAKDTEKFALDFNKKYPGIWFYYMRVNNMVQMVAQAMNDGEVHSIRRQVALALEDMRFKVDTGEVWMRKSDHQAMQPLYISIFSQGRRKDGQARLGRHGLRLEDASDDLATRLATADFLHHGTSVSGSTRAEPGRALCGPPPPDLPLAGEAIELLATLDH
jgi:hypothetical protein